MELERLSAAATSLRETYVVEHVSKLVACKLGMDNVVPIYLALQVALLESVSKECYCEAL